MRKRLVGVALVSFALVATSGPDPRSEGAAVRAGTSSAAVTDCGTFNLSQGEELPDSAIRCFEETAQARHRARLEETRLTVEDDPIPVTYIADAGGRVEVITDSRQDTFGRQIVNAGPATPNALSRRGQRDRICRW